MAKSAALNAIKARCKDCIGEPPRPVRCEANDCPLFGYRTGRNFYDRRRNAPLSRQNKPSGGFLGAIRAYCRWCCNGSGREARLCPATTCPLHPLLERKKEPK